MSYNTSIICNKHDINLSVEKTNKLYRIIFNSPISDSLNIEQIITFNIFNLLQKLNNDLIEEILIIDGSSEDEKNIIYKFKNLAKDFDINPRYMAINTIRKIANNNTDEINNNFNVNFISSNIKLTDDIKVKYGIFEYDTIDCDFAKLNIYTNKKIIYFDYSFKLMPDDNLPIYIENIIGLMMKKTFYNIKQFIENFKIYNYEESVS